MNFKKLMTGSFGTLCLLIILLAVFACLSNLFFTPSNITNLLVQSGTNAIIAIGMTFVIISGNIDISVGAVLALAGCMGARVMVLTGSTVLGVFITLGMGAVLGLLNGTMVAYLGFQPFIVTLATMWLYRGCAYLFTGGRAIVGLPASFVQIGRGMILNLPNVVWMIAVLYIVMWFILQKTTFGRKICAIGDNQESARLSGINVKRTKLIVFCMSGFFAALSGLVYMSRLNSGQPIAGQSYEMYAIAAAVIGGASLVKGGIGNIVGTLIGAIFIAGLQNGLTILNVNTYWQQVCMGLVVLLAVGLDRLRKTVS
ncbi:MAG: ABC transporter permease [Synergistaceae bacterium]|nr:ABC transporter permease [Synergistaceae bacterium]